ncbi:hypothetical protein RhiirA5_418671 [Rhizophagus irregularis]|uniref:Protein kinase domain-containing protein n=1 Tax=Rhizophagus irregularis TaxID=588596 RepID=A0A2N0PJV9_9GLOM|nr:hypothetical protein RhiirA5_418671 [Rhizophagus irregularis]
MAFLFSASYFRAAPQIPTQKETGRYLYQMYYADRLNGLLRDKIIDHYDSRDLINSKIIGFGGSASVYIANWKNTPTMYAIKKSVNNKEVCLTFRANSHENIIQFRGVTKLKDEKKMFAYSRICGWWDIRKISKEQYY